MEGNEMRYSFTMAFAAGAMLLSSGDALAFSLTTRFGARARHRQPDRFREDRQSENPATSNADSDT
jgi:hypothetical protein